VKRSAWLGLTGLAVALVAAVVFSLRGDRELAEALAQRGRVAVWGAEVPRAPDGTRLLPAGEVAGLRAALDGDDPLAVARALQGGDANALLVGVAQPGGDTVGARLRALAAVEGLQALYLSPRYALYVPEPSYGLGDREREAMASVARALLGGAEPPRLTSFPQPLRRVAPVEVMVLLRENGRARLWRSARGSSLARALLTAVKVARKRWIEREHAMGASLTKMLPKLDVEVSLLVDDGTLGDRSPVFIDRAFSPKHGIGYERKGAWRYLLPAATKRRGKGRASQAYLNLFATDGLQPESLASPEVRLYRLRVVPLATSPARPPAPPPDDGLAPVHDPAEVIATPDAGAPR
jgi:hypothetical protein